MKDFTAEKPREIPFMDSSTMNLCSTASRDYVDLAHHRVDMYYKLRDMRVSSVGGEERNNYCFMVYNAFAPCYGHDVAFEKCNNLMLDFKNLCQTES